MPTSSDDALSFCSSTPSAVNCGKPPSVKSKLNRSSAGFGSIAATNVPLVSSPSTTWLKPTGKTSPTSASLRSCTNCGGTKPLCWSLGVTM